MSWDIFVQDLPSDVSSVDEIPDDFEPKPLGQRSEIIRKIMAIVPEADFTDPSWGVVDHPDFSVEFNMGNSELLEHFALHVRGGDAAAGLVCEVLATLSLRALDSGSGGFFDPGAAGESLRKWRLFRDRVVGGAGAA